mmetsp:Transcript_16133/g.16265  ORF Transcript_16133/g.16265 Transcript_16133/m.16265 type:complete len:133 (+) Transcript_16133:141-539(+)|eukprot:CAMPEP_0182427524 /NCGR_PEP_ID=MMETSP1167-20130531/18163_1 /TAXON_ID=2988 /ORGANISM="Mallomonas Sp, Strain CCMP3275" /LENGTH=132 /DNA_ID=CAMNT_0024609829 /DNA_START=124 /DNA_END=522 /DNA_ORIENTATION=+
MNTLEGGQPVIEVFLPTYRMEPEEKERFYPSQARAIAQKITEEELKDQEFDEGDALGWSNTISDKIREAVVTNLNIMRYKVIVQTTIGQMKDQGVRVASRCLWDIQTDNYASISYTNQSLFCSVLIFALYTD